MMYVCGSTVLLQYDIPVYDGAYIDRALFCVALGAVLSRTVTLCIYVCRGGEVIWLYVASCLLSSQAYYWLIDYYLPLISCPHDACSVLHERPTPTPRPLYPTQSTLPKFKGFVVSSLFHGNSIPLSTYPTWRAAVCFALHSWLPRAPFAATDGRTTIEIPKTLGPWTIPFIKKMGKNTRGIWMCTYRATTAFIFVRITGPLWWRRYTIV